MQRKKFQRKIEDFTCERCGHHAIGDGYTNHCSQCLWSKHVDVHPGDRAAPCGGMMKPVAVEGTTPTYTLLHRCERCGYERRNTVRPADSPETLIAIAKTRR